MEKRNATKAGLIYDAIDGSRYSIQLANTRYSTLKQIDNEMARVRQRVAQLPIGKPPHQIPGAIHP